MALPLALAIGAGLSILGQYKERKARAAAERANAAYLLEQKKLTEMANRREADIFLTESEKLIGTQKSMLGRAGIDFSGSALMGLVESKSMQAREFGAILANGQAATRLAEIRAKNAQDMARFYGSGEMALIQGAGTVLNAYIGYENFRMSGKTPGAELNVGYSGGGYWDIFNGGPRKGDLLYG